MSDRWLDTWMLDKIDMLASIVQCPCIKELFSHFDLELVYGGLADNILIFTIFCIIYGGHVRIIANKVFMSNEMLAQFFGYILPLR